MTVRQMVITYINSMREGDGERDEAIAADMVATAAVLSAYELVDHVTWPERYYRALRHITTMNNHREQQIALAIGGPMINRHENYDSGINYVGEKLTRTFRRLQAGALAIILEIDEAFPDLRHLSEAPAVIEA